MKILDPGHRYELRHLDGDNVGVLQFVKREGPIYPGNVGHYEGTTMQEVLRALIDRAKYVNAQIPCEETEKGIELMREAVRVFESRAAKRHGRVLPDVIEIENEPVCDTCGHVGCEGLCR